MTHQQPKPYKDADELPSDARMLDWLERHPEYQVKCWVPDTGERKIWRIHLDTPNGGRGFTGDTLRQAIEYAMKKVAE